ncbi:hypothetical protein [Streptomyces termitum]|uniref:hypothetical protein n=1 Tax=Streptomyces termitum TaxID=67368 RepID=UPI00379D2CE2
MRGTRGGPAALLLAAALVGALAGCGAQEPDPEDVAAWREDYCQDLYLWQRLAHDPPEKGYGNDLVLAASAVVTAAKVLDRHHLDHGGSHVLRDTGDAVSANDRYAEGRISAYCSAVGFETLMKY